MSRFKKVIKKKELESALAKHPLRELDEQVKEDYIKGLVFIAMEDENFDEDERSYITSLMKNIGINEAKLGEFETFASDCEEDELLAFMDRLKAFDEDIKINFMIEVVVIAFKDGEFDEAEQEMFNDYLEMLELTDKKDDIMYLATALVNKDIDLALSLYTAKKEMFEKYDYMFDMLDIDIEKELKSVFSYEWTVWDMRYGSMTDGNKVAIQPETVQKYCIVINSLILSGDLVRRAGTNSFINKDDASRIIFEDIDAVNLELEETLFSYSCAKNDSILLRGGTLDYSEWIRTQINKSFYPIYIKGDTSGDIAFQANCANMPDDDIYEQFINTTTYKDSYYTSGDFDDSANNYKQEYNPTEFTFRLMKSGGE